MIASFFPNNPVNLFDSVVMYVAVLEYGPILVSAKWVFCSHSALIQELTVALEQVC